RIALAMGAMATAVAVVAAMLWLRPSPSPIAAEATAAAAPSGVAAIPSGSPPAAATAAIPQIDDEALSRRLRAADPSPLPAWRALLALWQLPTIGADAVATGACTAPVATGVYCLRGLASLDKLAIQGRPALLRLRADGDEAWALLLGADAVNVRLQLGVHALDTQALDTQAFDTDRIALERVWAGEYATLWRAPAAMDPMPTTPLGGGARGPLVDWVRERLQPRFLPASDGPAQVDAAMRDAVRRYQRARGLSADGVIGPETLMALSSGEVGPQLLRVLE
ncbi:MAG: peptidoglycan-binding protein, partial [Lysobacter sp.]